METVFDRYVVGKALQGKFNVSSIFKKRIFLNVDLAMCQSYSYRFSLYNYIMGKYPTGENEEGLVSDFDSVNLSDKEADKLFNKEYLTYKNTDKIATFECVEPNSGEKYNFQVNK